MKKPTLVVWIIAIMLSSVIYAATDEIQIDYLKRMMNLKLDIINKSTDIKRAAIRNKTQMQLGIVDIKSRGRVSASTREETYRAEDDTKVAEKEFKALGKEIAALKSEMIKHYKGKMPKILKTEIGNLESEYIGIKIETDKEVIEIQNKKTIK